MPLTIPLSTATPLIESGTGAPGSGSKASKDDHVHPGAFATAAPALTFGTSNAAGSATTAIATDATIAIVASVSTMWRALLAGGTSEAVMTQNQMVCAQVFVPFACTLTGLAFRVAAVSNGNLKVALFDSSGTRVALSAATACGGSWGVQQVAFSAPYAAAAGVYYVGIVSDSATATFMKQPTPGYSVAISTAYTTPPTSITPSSSTSVLIPDCSTY